MAWLGTIKAGACGGATYVDRTGTELPSIKKGQAVRCDRSTM